MEKVTRMKNVWRMKWWNKSKRGGKMERRGEEQYLKKGVGREREREEGAR